MSDVVNPYGADLGALDAREALRQTPEAIRGLCARMTPRDYARATAPGKWSVSEILLHLAHVEVIFQSRLRFALSTPGYVVQPFDQDNFMRVEPPADGPAALEAYTALRRLSRPLIDGLTAEQLEGRFTHPDFGELSVGWLLAWCAGHERRHLGQIEQIAAAL